MTPDDFTPKYKRRRPRRRAELAVGASTLLAASATVIRLQDADAPAQLVTPKAIPATSMPRNVVSLGIRRSLGTTTKKAILAHCVWNLEQIQRSVQLRIDIASAELAQISHRRHRLS